MWLVFMICKCIGVWFELGFWWIWTIKSSNYRVPTKFYSVVHSKFYCFNFVKHFIKQPWYFSMPGIHGRLTAMRMQGSHVVTCTQISTLSFVWSCEVIVNVTVVRFEIFSAVFSNEYDYLLVCSGQSEIRNRIHS